MTSKRLLYVSSGGKPSLNECQLTCKTTCLRNLQKVLELGGSSLDKVVKYNVYLADMADFAEMNEAYIAVGISSSALQIPRCSVPAQY